MIQGDSSMYENETVNVPWKALLGAALGTIPGIFAWAGLGYLGVTWALVGLVIVFGAFWMYDKFGGESDNQYGVIGVVILCILAVYCGVHLSWSLQLYGALKDEGDISLSNCITRLFPVLDYLDLKGKYVLAVLKGYLFAALGAGGLIGRALQGNQ